MEELRKDIRFGGDHPMDGPTLIPDAYLHVERRHRPSLGDVLVERVGCDVER